MNANDLADRLEQFYTGTHIEKAAEVLRQLQAENDKLRKEIESIEVWRRG
jgi:2-methylcitrate dehydratase PrpD